jgi:hypothetical protein
VKAPLAPVAACADFVRFGQLPFSEPLWELPDEFVRELRFVYGVYREHEAREAEQAGRR